MEFRKRGGYEHHRAIAPTLAVGMAACPEAMGSGPALDPGGVGNLQCSNVAA